LTDGFEQGQVIAGRYRVLSKLGAGGMADVYLAEDTTLGRLVAVKVLLQRYAGDAQFVERFRREAQAAARINHPNIVNIYDWGPVDGTYYIVMEYVEGETLKDHIRRDGRYAPGEAVRIALELLGAVQVAHAAHIVHRDIKSQNILIDPAGAVKVTDFGIAKADDSQMTEAGSILGTAQYLAPEQAKGEPVDERTDLYSVGVVVYEMLTGSLPFRGDSAVTVALKHVNEQPPEPVELVPGLPYSLNQIVLKALAKDPDLRYRTAAEFSADLVAARSGGPLLAAAYDPSLERTVVQTQTAGNEGATRVLPKAAVGAGLAAGAGAAAGAAANGRAANGSGGNGRDARRRKRSPWPWIALVAFLVIAAVAGAFVWRSFFGSTTVGVPPVVGQTQAAATAQLRTDGFAVKAHDDYSDQYGLGLVTRQQPASGAKLAKGGTVDIWVSRGRASTTLESMTGFTPAAVKTYLASNGLVGKEHTGSSTAVPKGVVYKQSPQAGVTVKRGDTIEYWVSRGLPQVSVPDLSGLDQGQATAAIQSDGLLVGQINPTPSSSVPLGHVVGQTPSANVLVAKGTIVSFTISSGSPSPTPSDSSSPTGALTPVPSVVTMPQTQAEQILTEDGFQVFSKKGSSTLGSGFVYKQDPSSGSAPAGSTVTIWVTQ
jgi:eukaryotic-like serine/threonine-protein kinase